MDFGRSASTYEIHGSEEVGWGDGVASTKHSGRGAWPTDWILGFEMSDGDIAAIFARFKEIGDKKKFVYDDDLTALVEGHITEVPETWSLDYLSVSSGNKMVPTATVRLKKQSAENGPEEVLQDAGIGDGPVDAALKAIDRLTRTRGRLMDYSLRAVSQGKDALGKLSVKVDFGNKRLSPGKARAPT